MSVETGGDAGGAGASAAWGGGAGAGVGGGGAGGGIGGLAAAARGLEEKMGMDGGARNRWTLGGAGTGGTGRRR
jgi:hypothetical protein